MVKFKRCPRCEYGLNSDRRFCPNCGLDLIDAARKLEPFVSESELPKPQNSISGVLALVAGGVSLIAWVYPLCGFPVTFTGIIAGIIGSKGNDRRSALVGLLLSIFGLIATTANSSIGAYLGYTGQLFTEPSQYYASPTVPYATAYYIRQTQTARAYFPAFATLTAVAKQPDCYRWDQVTIQMKDKTVCVRGIVTRLVQYGNVGARYQFSDKPNTFFLYGTNYVVIDPVSGKTIGPGVCLQAIGVIRVQSSIPYINLDELKEGRSFRDFYFSKDSSLCY